MQLADLYSLSTLEVDVTKLEHTFMLAHALDGVIWGKIDAGVLTTSYDIAQQYDLKQFAQLRPETLQEVRLFSRTDYLHIWRKGATWKHNLNTTEANNSVIEETQVLWGTQAQAYGDWTLLRDGEQGLVQLVPLKLDAVQSFTDKKTSISYRLDDSKTPHEFTAKLPIGGPVGWRPAQLTVHHVLTDDNGFKQIAYTRCVDLTWQQGANQ